jgi:hypothetical protein
VNRFGLARVLLEYDGERGLTSADLAVPVIDDTPLFELVGAGHPGLVVRLVAPPSRHWLGEPSYIDHERLVVLDGSCGIAECCGVAARIDIGDATVCWSDFLHAWSCGTSSRTGLHVRQVRVRRRDR